MENKDFKNNIPKYNPRKDAYGFILDISIVIFFSIMIFIEIFVELLS